MGEPTGGVGVTVERYRPMMKAVVKQTEVSRARYPAVDAHNHYDPNWDLSHVLDVMDQCNVRVFADLSGGSGEHLKRKLDLLKGSHPDRFAVFYVPQFERVSEPDFAEREPRAIQDAAAQGAQGVKVFKSLGLGVRDATGTLLAVDDPRLDPVWQAAGEAGLPVLIHVADPWAFFDPLDETNERLGELAEHPDWHFYGPQYPPLNDLLEARDRVVERHPETTFIGAHVGSEVEDLDRASRLLDRCPNYVVDISARFAELGRQPRRARQFILDHQDHVLFGTDIGPDLPVYRNCFRILETDDECFEYWGYPGQGIWPVAGLDLPDDVLRKVYASNAERVVPGVR
ncbi:MAG TPA: amidohydrolase family protein [Armatimonadota bacterium]|jgi:predicted TIM-barrel fold metal-dependent hydrolase